MATSLKIKNAIVLSQQRCSEAILASLMLGLQICDDKIIMEEGHVEFSAESFVFQLLTNIGPTVIFQMLLTKNIRIQLMVVDALRIVSDIRSLFPFSSEEILGSLIGTILGGNLNFETLNDDAKKVTDLKLKQNLDLETKKQSIVRSAISASAITSQFILELVLERWGNKALRPAIALDFVSLCCFCLLEHPRDVAQTLNVGEDKFADNSNQNGQQPVQARLYSVRRLNEAQAAGLRSLVLAALAGSAPTALEDRALALRSLYSLLQPMPRLLSPIWTVETTISRNDTDIGVSSRSPGQFARFLCSMLRGEIQLATEEILDTSRRLNTLKSPSYREHEGETQENRAVDKRSDPMESDATKAGYTRDQLKQRVMILCQELPCLLSLCESVFQLLTGYGEQFFPHYRDFSSGLCNYEASSTLRNVSHPNNDGDVEVDDVSYGPWANLPGPVLLSVQRHMQEAVAECLDLLVWLAQGADRSQAANTYRRNGSGRTEFDRNINAFPRQFENVLNEFDRNINAFPRQFENVLNESNWFQRALQPMGPLLCRFVCSWSSEDAALRAPLLKHAASILSLSFTHKISTTSLTACTAQTTLSPCMPSSVSSLIPINSIGSYAFIADIFDSDEGDVCEYLFTALLTFCSADGDTATGREGALLVLEVTDLVPCLLKALCAIAEKYLMMYQPNDSRRTSPFSDKLTELFETACELLTAILTANESAVSSSQTRELQSLKLQEICGYAVDPELVSKFYDCMHAVTLTDVAAKRGIITDRLSTMKSRVVSIATSVLASLQPLLRQ